MVIDWIENKKGEEGEMLISATSPAATEESLQLAVESAITRAVELMARNVRDESRYFICEWNAQRQLLNITVTDETKTIESPIVLELSLPETSNLEEQIISEQMKFWLTDYLSTCTDFLKFSVIALFHTGDRNRGTLL